MTRKGQDHSHLVDGDLTGRIIGAFFECYNRLESGYLEAVYRRALVVELQARGHRCVREGLLEVLYKACVLATTDMTCW